MIVRGGGGFFGKVIWAFFVASVAFAIIGNPTVGPDKFKANLIQRSDEFKGLVDDWTRDLRSGEIGSGGADTGTPPKPRTPSHNNEPVKDIPRPKHTTRTEDGAALGKLAVTNKALGGYNRDDWHHWNNTRPCWSVREEVLYRDADKGSPVLVDSHGKRTNSPQNACGLVAGRWQDPYSKLVFTKPLDLDIDHVVPLNNASISGGANWSDAKKEQYANYLTDPNHLRAVAAAENRSKSAQTPAAWQPIDRAKHCWYAQSWVGIKTKWNLTITPAEKSALRDMLATCAD